MIFDAVVIAGDHLDVASSVDGGIQIVVTLKYLKRVMGRAQIIVSSGNHDLDFRDESGEKVARRMSHVRRLGIPTDGDTVTLGGTLVTICPWWDGPNTRREVEGPDRTRRRETENILGVGLSRTPSGSPACWDGKQFYGDAELTTWIETHQPETLSSPATSARRRSGGAARGPVGSVGLGCSTVAGRSGRCRPM